MISVFVSPPPVISFDADNRYVNDSVVKTFLAGVNEEFGPNSSVAVERIARKSDNAKETMVILFICK